MKPNTLPSSDASPFGGALNSTSTTPPKATQGEHQRARVDALVEQPAPIGTMRNGASEPISAALATLLCVAPAKKIARFRPKNTPGTSTWRTSRTVIRRPVLQSTAFQTTVTVTIRQNATSTPGDFGALDQRRAERERDDEPDDGEHAERLALSAGPPPC